MGVLRTIGLIGVGYAINEYRRTKPIRYRTIFDIPSYSEYFHELIVNKLDILFYGGEIHRRKKIPYRTTEYHPVNYSKYFENGMQVFENGMQVDNISFETRAEAEKVLDEMKEVLNEYGNLSIEDYYDLVNHRSVLPSDRTHGWLDLSSTEVRKNIDGHWYIDLEKPESI